MKFEWVIFGLICAISLVVNLILSSALAILITIVVLVAAAVALWDIHHRWDDVRPNISHSLLRWAWTWASEHSVFMIVVVVSTFATVIGLVALVRYFWEPIVSVLTLRNLLVTLGYGAGLYGTTWAYGVGEKNWPWKWQRRIEGLIAIVLAVVPTAACTIWLLIPAPQQPAPEPSAVPQLRERVEALSGLEGFSVQDNSIKIPWKVLPKDHQDDILKRADQRLKHYAAMIEGDLVGAAMQTPVTLEIRMTKNDTVAVIVVWVEVRNPITGPVNGGRPMGLEIPWWGTNEEAEELCRELLSRLRGLSTS